MSPVTRPAAADGKEETHIALTTSATRGVGVDDNSNKNLFSLYTTTIPSSGNVNKNPLSSLGDASGVSILLGNHAKFGSAERTW